MEVFELRVRNNEDVRTIYNTNGVPWYDVLDSKTATQDEIDLHTREQFTKLSEIGVPAEYVQLTFPVIPNFTYANSSTFEYYFSLIEEDPFFPARVHRLTHLATAFGLDPTSILDTARQIIQTPYLEMVEPFLWLAGMCPQDNRFTLGFLVLPLSRERFYKSIPLTGFEITFCRGNLQPKKAYYIDYARLSDDEKNMVHTLLGYTPTPIDNYTAVLLVIEEENNEIIGATYHYRTYVPNPDLNVVWGNRK